LSIPISVHPHISRFVPKEYKFDLWSVELDGLDDQISIPTLDLGGWSAITILWRICWYSDYGETYPYIYNFGDNYSHYGYYDMSTFHLQLKISGTVHGVAYAFKPALRWDMYALRWESGDYIRLYRNGVQVAISDSAYTGTLDSTADRPHLLGNNGATTRTVHGRYAHFALYNRALSTDEMYELSRLSYMRPLPGCICCLPMEEGAGLTVRDISGNGNHGTLVNGPVWRRNSMWELLAESGL